MAAGRGGRFSAELLAAVVVALFLTTGVGSAQTIHGGYATTSSSCGMCHDLHENANWKLFTFNEVLEGCVYCHGPAGGGVQVYTGDATHRIDGNAVMVPDATTNDSINGQLDCIDCHDAAPHGAGEGLYGHLTTATDAISFCVSCHDRNDGRVLNGSRASRETHVMIAKGDAYLEFGSTTATHADDGASTESCASCHTDRADYPHSGNFKLLKAGASASALDTTCLDCHRTGVGVAY